MRTKDGGYLILLKKKMLVEALRIIKTLTLSLQKKADEIIRLVDNYTLILDEYHHKEEYLNITSLKDRYYDSSMFENTKARVNEIKNSLSGKELFYDFPYFDETALDTLLTKHNIEYVQSHLNDNLFNDISGRSLDIEQRTAVLKDETSALTIAGAGSGKTLTICGKLKYLLNSGVNPNEILLLSYSKKSADDLDKKAKQIHPGLEAITFHKLGLEILKEKRGTRFMIEEQYDAIIESYFRDEMKNDPKAMKEILRYYALYINPFRGIEHYEDDGELYQELKAADLHTLKDTLSNISDAKNMKRTIKKELIKSIEELDIANFYFLNGINYTYEKPYQYDVSDNEHRQYTPDFYLDDYRIYHEHYGIDENGKAKQYDVENAKKYEEGVAWKRKLHTERRTKCIETFSYEFSDGTLFDNLAKKLKENGVKFHPLNANAIQDAIESIYDGKSFKSLIALIKSFLSLYKAKYSDGSAFDELKKKPFKDKYTVNRASLFLDICKYVYIYYRNHLESEGKIDFDDMILQSKKELRELEGFRYKYVIVDEFQDISYSRMEFLKAIIEHGKSKLFAVGDDWQAIYRFSGCDLGLFLNFENYLGKSVINYITSTHRNSQELQDIAGEFIRKNPQQMNKTIQSAKHLEKPVKIIYYLNDKNFAFQETLSRVGSEKKDASVLVLGRNNRDLDDILGSNIKFSNSFSSSRNSALRFRKYPEMSIRYSTVHSSKGLEEDYTIIINADDDRYGFPNKTEDDPLLSLVLSESDKMIYAEERRLWYVALTRTRSYCYILVNEYHPSMFVDEIKDKCELINKKLKTDQSNEIVYSCPHCKSGNLILRIGNRNENFYGCSNYPYCDYTIGDLNAVKENIRCPVCDDFLIKKEGKYSTYYICHNNRYCHYRIKADKLQLQITSQNQSKKNS